MILSDYTRPDLLAKIKQIIADTEENTEVKHNLNFIRTPFTITCNTWKKRGEYLFWAANPSEVSWTLDQRSSEQKTRMGTVLHVWKDNNRDTYYDEPVIDISFQSGSIFPVKNSSGRFVINNNLSAFYKFLELVDEDKTDESNRANMVHIMYSSSIFPSMVLSGMFAPTGLGWSDNAESPFEVSNWRARFIVKDTSPRIGKNGRAELLRTSFNQAMSAIPSNLTGTLTERRAAQLTALTQSLTV